MFFWWFIVSALHWFVVHGSYDVMLEDVTCAEVNEEYITACEIESDYDSTYGSSLDTYLEIAKTFPKDTRLLLNMLTVEMGEYTVDMGLQIDTNLCEIMEDKKTIGVPMLRAVNMENGKCPPKPGTYQRENYVIDSPEGLPPTFPTGPYLVNMTIIDEEEELNGKQMRLDNYNRTKAFLTPHFIQDK